MGGKLGTIFGRPGHDVVFSYAHSERKLKRLAREAGKRASAGTPREAADAGALLLAVHWSRVNDVWEQAGDVSGKVIVTCSLPMNASDTALAVAHTSSGAEVLARKLRRPTSCAPSARCRVKCSSTCSAQSGERGVDRVSCTAGMTGTQNRSTLIRDVGFEAVDAGPLKIARYLEPFALAMAPLAYERDSGPEIAYRIEHFKSRG